MEIKLSKSDYKHLLKLVAVSSHMYGVMSDLVSDQYKIEAKQSDALIDKLLSYNDDVGIECTYKGKKSFNDVYMDGTMTDLMEYEDFSFWDILARDMAKKIFSQQIISSGDDRIMTEEEIMSKIFKIEEKLEMDFVQNGLKNIEYVGKDNLLPYHK